MATALVRLLGKVLAKRNGLLPAELLEVAMARVLLEAVDRLRHHVERRLASPVGVLQGLAVLALDALVVRAVLLHGKSFGPRGPGLGGGRGGGLLRGGGS